MQHEEVKAYFSSDPVVAHYGEAARRIGLWLSEEKIFRRLFRPEDSLLELGCGVGRIAIGLYELGYHNVLATDYARPMVASGRQLSQQLEYRIPFRVADATALEFEDAVFDGAIFGFNGLMQIPGAASRAAALAEIRRVVRPGGWFVFTTHDRDRSPHRGFWEAERGRWEAGREAAELEDFGDRCEPTPDGLHYMHVPTVAEMQAALAGAGWRVEATVMRSELAQESAEVEAFADDCRFWVVQRPES
jgi:SAM-dependent methyltransferase